jgi:hypothetical protein
MEIERKDIFDLYLKEKGNIALFGATNTGKTIFCRQIEKFVQHAIYINITENVYSENDLAEKIFAISYSNFGLQCKNTNFLSAENFNILTNIIKDRDKYFVDDTILALTSDKPHTKYLYALKLIDKLAISFDKNVLFIIENFANFANLYTTVAESYKVFALTCNVLKSYKRVSFIFTGLNEKFCKLFTSSKSNLYRFAKIINMPQITYDEYNKYINQWLTVDEQVSKEIIETSEYSLQYINEILRELLLHCMISGNSICKDDVKIIAERVYQNNIPSLNLRLRVIRGKKHLLTILSFIAQDKNPYEIKEIAKSNINKYLSILSDEGLIFTLNIEKNKRKKYEISYLLLKKHILHLSGGS